MISATVLAGRLLLLVSELFPWLLTLKGKWNHTGLCFSFYGDGGRRCPFVGNVSQQIGLLGVPVDTEHKNKDSAEARGLKTTWVFVVICIL